MAITSGPPRPHRPRRGPHVMAVSGSWWQGRLRAIGHVGLCLACRQRHDAGLRSVAGRRSGADRPDPGDRDGPDAVQPGRAVPAPAVGDHVDSPKTRRAIGRRDRVAQGDEQASRWPTGVRELGTYVGRSVPGVGDRRACNSNGCAFVQPLYVTPTPAPGRSREVGCGSARTPSEARRYQDDRDRMCRRITEQTTRGFAFPKRPPLADPSNPDEPRVWLAARRVRLGEASRRAGSRLLAGLLGGGLLQLEVALGAAVFFAVSPGCGSLLAGDFFAVALGAAVFLAGDFFTSRLATWR